MPSKCISSATFWVSMQYEYNFLFSEPMGAKAPTFSGDSKSFTFMREVGQHFALLCQAQGYPTPLFRQVAPLCLL